MKAKRKEVVCWNCRGSGITEEGDTQDGIPISPDIECWLCEGSGFVEINGKQHKKYRKFCMPNTKEFIKHLKSIKNENQIDRI